MKSFSSPVTISQRDSIYDRNLLRYLGDAAPETITLQGDLDVLLKPNGNILGFFCSAKSTASVLLAVQDLAYQWRKQRQLIISGFHSLAEQEFLEVMLGGDSPVIICPARGIGKMRTKEKWREPLERGNLLIISPFDDTIKRPTRQIAHQRNRFVAALADEIFIAHAEPGSMTARLRDEIQEWGKPILTLENIA